MSLATTASIVGIAGGLNSIFGDSGGQQSAPTSGGTPAFYQPTGTAAADQSWLAAMNQINGGVGSQAEMITPQLQSAYRNLVSINPSGYLSAGNQAGAQSAQQAGMAQLYQQMMQIQAAQSAGAQQRMYGQGNQQFGAGQGMQNYGQGIMGNAAPLIAAGNQAFAAGQDPQQALYARMLQQTQDQSRAATSMRGIGMSPEAAGIENQAVGNFNIDWQNQQLQRMMQGLSGMGGAYNAAGNQYGAGTQAFGAGTQAANAGTNAYNAGGSQGQLTGANLTGAMNFGTQIPGLTLQGGQLPYQTAQTAYGAPINATNAYTGAMNQGVYQPYGAMQNSVIPYLNYGQGAAGNAFNYGNQQQTFDANQQAQGMKGLTQGLNALSTQANDPGSWMGQMFGGQQQTPYYGAGGLSGAQSSASDFYY